MHSAQQIMSYIAMKKRSISHVLRGENNVPFTNDQSTSLVRTLNNILGGKYLPNMGLTNSLSVTVVNNEILNSDRLLENSSTKIKDMSHILRTKTLLIESNLKQRDSTDMYKDCIESLMNPSNDSLLGHEVNPVSYLHDWDTVDDFNLISRNDANFMKNFYDTYKENNSTMESHSVLRVNETETEDKIDATGHPSDVDPQKYEINVHKDTDDTESFHMVSHWEVPTVPADFDMKSTVSHVSNVFRNALNYLSFYLTAGMAAKRSTKHRRKANAIAIGRGRGRARCQLRRSGVSQTVCRKECIKNDDCEQSNLVAAAPNDCPLDNKLDNLDNVNIPVPTQVAKQIDGPNVLMSSLPKGTARKGKPKACAKKKTKAKYMTKVRYIANSSMSNYIYCEDSNSETSDAHEEDSFRSRTLSENSSDFEDSWIVFEDDEELHERCEEREATEHPIDRAHNVPDSSMRKNDSPCEDSNSKTRDAVKTPIRFRSSSESSEDYNNCNSAALDEQKATKYSRMHYGYFTKIIDKCQPCKVYQMQKNLPRHHRLPSDSSENSDDFNGFKISDCNNSENSDESNNSENLDNLNNSFATEDDVDGSGISFHDGDSQFDDMIIFADEDSEELLAQTKKVSFDPTPVVHVMVTWNYAYRAARKGPWEEIARDNERFRGRIRSIAIVLEPILRSKHRSQIWKERFALPE